MKSEILFLGPYPTARNIKDGMVSRIRAIDAFFTGVRRTYVEISFTRYWKRVHTVRGEVVSYQVNAFVHVFLLARLILSAPVVYAHSIHKWLPVAYLLPFYHGRLVLDAHGAVPEEIRIYSKKQWAAPVLERLERCVFGKAALVICVTEQMKKHFFAKYPCYAGRYVVYGIFPETLRSEKVEERGPAAEEDPVRVIYSGGISPWQLLDLTLDTIKRNQAPRLEYTLLVTDRPYVERLLEAKGMKHLPVRVLSVQPEELAAYYSRADYAFILRQDNVVNRVANPTKLVEYLRFGLIPIVLSEQIGDYAEQGYERVPLSRFNVAIPKPEAPSLLNQEIARRLLENNEKIDIRHEVFRLGAKSGKRKSGYPG